MLGLHLRQKVLGGNKKRSPGLLIKMSLETYPGSGWCARVYVNVCKRARVYRCVWTYPALDGDRVAMCVCINKEGHISFNDAVNTFYLRLYGVRHNRTTQIVRGNPLPPHGLLFPINSKGSFICTIPQTGKYIPRLVLHQLWSTGRNEK